MSTQLPTKLLPVVKSPPPRRLYPVRVLDAQGRYRTLAVEAGSPEEAGAEGLLRVLGPDRPAGSPDEVDVEGAPYAVEEWLTARVFLVPTAADHRCDARERLQAERALFHLKAADDALYGLAASAREPGDARAARYDAASVCQIATRLRDLADRRGGSR